MQLFRFKKYNIIFNPHKYLILNRYYSDLDTYQAVPHYKEKSALYVPSKNIKNKVPIFARIFKPEIDLEYLLSNTQCLARNLHARNILLDLSKLKDDYLKLIEYRYKLKELDEVKIKISKEIGKFVSKSKLSRDKAFETQDGQELLSKAKEIENRIDKLNETNLPLEEIVHIACLRLPNYLHKNVPNDYNHVLFEWNELGHLQKYDIDLSRDNSIINRWDHVLLEKSTLIKRHVEWSHNYDEHGDNIFDHYLTGNYALLEMAIRNYFLYKLESLKSPHLEYQKGVSMVKSPIIEGCGYYFNDTRELLNIVRFSSDIELLHLCGNSSLYSLVVNLANSTTTKSLFPWLIYTDGKSYSPKYGQKSQLNLLALCSKKSSYLVQNDGDLDRLDSKFEAELESSLDRFLSNDSGILIEDLLSHSKDDIDSTFIDLCKLLIYLYKDLNTRFKLSNLTASSLKTNECLKVALEMLITSEQKYVTIAEVSLIDDFISKRLGIKFKQDKKSKKNKSKEFKMNEDNDDSENNEINQENKLNDNVSMIHVKLVDINLFMRCLIESNTMKNGTFVVPDVLKKFYLK